MKKTGFTLAEVLITLAIIGVVATMTLPALMNNTQEQQAKTGFKKGINTLTEAVQTNHAINGFDYSDITTATTDLGEGVAEEQSMGGLLYNRTQIDYTKSGVGSATNKDANAVDPSGNFVVFFRDGSAVSFNGAANPGPADAREIQADGLAKGFGVIYDYNGAKKPNILSNCNADAGLTADNATANDAGDPLTKCTRANRVIKDQFGVVLRGTFAYPNGAAARWAYDN